MAERSDSVEGEILEGFLCPICKHDLKSFNRLTNHFQEVHPEDQDVLKSLKELFGKATKKILKLDDNLTQSFKANDEYEIENEIQEIGYTYSHTERFKEIRCDRLEHFVTETNKLIIRLHQLLQISSTDRKQREQEVVHWLDGSSVSLCPQCTKSFNITTRQHHCRLCGTIMCHSCSLFLSVNVAHSFISGIHENNIPKTVDESNSIRICCYCMKMLDYRRRVQLNRTSKPVICEFYDRLRKLKKEIEPNVELYNKMCASLHAGEQTYKLPDAQTLRGNIGKQGELLDAISKQISEIPLNPDIPRAITLQNAIRRATSNYIKDTLLSLPPLPTLAELIEKRKQIQNQIEPKIALKPIASAVYEGWSADISKNVKAKISADFDDPILQQIENVKDFIEQARKAMKFDEVASLEANLRELKLLYKQNQMEKQES